MRKTFEKLFENMPERRNLLEEGDVSPDYALELLRQEILRERGCPDDEELCGLVDGQLKEKNFRRYIEVWRHVQIEHCDSCERNIKNIETIIPSAMSTEPTTLSEVLKRAAQRYNLPDALNYKRDGKWHSISSKELFGRARAITLGLYSLGVRRGDLVALMSENCPEWTITDAGCQLAGVVDVAIPPKREPEDVRDALIETDARVLFIRNRAAYASIAQAIENCATLERVVFFDEGGAHEASMQEARALTLTEVEARGRALDAEQPTLAEELAQAVRPRDLATLIYTSGTTGEKGKPKLVMLTHENLVSNILACVDHFAPMFYWRLLKDNSLVSLPLWHAPGRIIQYIHLHQGVCVDCAESEVYAEEPESLESLKKIFDNICEKHPTLVIGPPKLFKEMPEQIRKAKAGDAKDSLLAWAKASLLAWAVDIGEEWAQCQFCQEPVSIPLKLKQKLVSLIFPRLALGGRIRLLMSVEMTLPEIIAWFYKGVGLPIHQGYGLTEASPVIAFGVPKDDGIVPDWRSLGNVEVSFSAKGELEVRGPNVMMGYYKNRDLTEDVFTEDGRLRTDDSGAWVIEGIAFEFEPHGMVANGKESIEAAILGLTYVKEAEIKSDDGTSLIAKIRLDYERLVSDKQFKGLGTSTEDELRKHPIIIKYFQEQVDSLKMGDIRVAIVKAIKKTATGKTIVPQGIALSLLKSALLSVLRGSRVDGRRAMQSQSTA